MKNQRTRGTKISHLKRSVHDQPIGFLIRELRRTRQMTARELGGKIKADPRVINAIETGRIRNPSIDRLGAIARAFGISLAQLVSQYEARLPGNFSLTTSGAQGAFTIDYSKKGFKLISYTPAIQEMFCGKMILGGKKKIDPTTFDLPVLIFLQVIIGKIIVTYQGNEQLLKEGSTLLLNGRYEFSFLNPTLRDVSLLFFTAPAPWGQAFLKA